MIHDNPSIGQVVTPLPLGEPLHDLHNSFYTCAACDQPLRGGAIIRECLPLCAYCATAYDLARQYLYGGKA